MTYYSALHYAAKAEKSATSAANSAQTAQTAAAQASQASGKIIQLGFDGAMEDGKLVFKHAPSGVEIPYSLLDDYEYELDLAYNGDLDSLTTMVVKNGSDTINFVSALHRSSTEPARVADMDAVMRYDATTGYRWLFKATFKIAPNGAKVFLLYPVVAAKDYGDKTNCITEIPQDIKLDLKDGVLDTKSGSRLWVPFGTEDLTAQHPVGSIFLNNNFKVAETKFSDGKFFVCVEVVADIPHSKYGSVSNDYMLTIDVEGNTDCPLTPVGSSSGTTDSSATEYIHYNTTTNRISYLNSAGKKSATCSFPIAICSRVSGVVSGVVQVFNGFGYIGSTVFALPGVKGLMPNGRNADGSLRNIEFVLSKVGVRSDINPNVSGFFALNGIANGFIDWGTSYKLTDDNYLNTSYGDKVSNVVSGLFVTDSSGKIISFTPKQAFHAVDRNDSSWVAQQAMPSSKYIDLTLGASGTEYVSPANGWFFISKMSGVNSSARVAWIYPSGSDDYSSIMSSYVTGNTGVACTCLLPVKKGDKYKLIYTATGTTNYFRFIYAEGEE